MDDDRPMGGFPGSRDEGDSVLANTDASFIEVPEGTLSRCPLEVPLPEELWEQFDEIVLTTKLPEETVALALSEFLAQSVDNLRALVANYIAGDVLVNTTQSVQQPKVATYIITKPPEQAAVVINKESGGGMSAPSGTFKRKKKEEDHDDG